MAMPGWSRGGYTNPVEDDITGKRNRRQMAEREQGNAKVFDAATAQFGEGGANRLLLNSEGHYYLPQSANPRRRAPEGDTNWTDPYVGVGMGKADTKGLQDAQGILGMSSGLAEADMYDLMMNRSRAAQGQKPMPTRQDHMAQQHGQGYDAFAQAMAVMEQQQAELRRQQERRK